MRTILSLSLLAVVGCADQPRVAQDIAMLCVDTPSATTSAQEPTTAATPVATTEGAEGGWTLTAIGSAGCHTKDLVVTCDTEVDGDTIRVTTESSWVATERLSWTCEMMLRQTQTLCELPELEDGAYVIEYADVELALDVPNPVAECVNPNG